MSDSPRSCETQVNSEKLLNYTYMKMPPYQDGNIELRAQNRLSTPELDNVHKLTPSIVLTPYEADVREFEHKSNVSSAESLSVSNSPRTSYNSLLHWGQSNRKDEIDYLTAKYSELPGEVLVFEVPVNQLLIDSSQKKNIRLGLKLAGSRDLNQMSVFVCGIYPGSLMDRDGHIEIGDQLLELNNQTLYGLSHLNAAPLIRSIYLEAIGASSTIFRRVRTNGLRFVVQRHSENINLMAAIINNMGELSSSRTSPRSSVETTSCLASISSTITNKAKKSLEYMNLAFGSDGQGSLVEQVYECSLYRASNGFGFAIMEGSQTNEEGIYVKQIIEGGSADKDGTLAPGDRIVSVNKRDATKASYETVLEWIKNSKHELAIQVTRWGFSFHMENRSSKEPKRFSAPMIANFAGMKNIRRHIKSAGCMSPNYQPNFTALKISPNKETEICLLSSPQLDIEPKKDGPKNSNSMTSVLPPILNVANENQAPEMTESTEVEKNEEPHTTRPIIPGQQTEISITVTDKKGFGISCIGGAETSLNLPVVHEIYPNGAATIDGRLQLGDHLLKVNNNTLVGLPFQEAINHLHSAYMNALALGKSEPNDTSAASEDGNQGDIINNDADDSHSKTGSSINLTVFRPEKLPEKWYDEELTIELMKKSGKGLGISITERCVHMMNKDTLTDVKTSYGVMITEIIKGLMVSVDGQILIGDQILSVNGVDTMNLTSEAVGTLLKSAQNKIVLRVGRLRNQVSALGATSALFLSTNQLRQ